MELPMPALIGHRGLPTQAPENTKASIIAAAENGIQWVEIDVTMAGDGSLVIMHDPDLRLFNQPEKRLLDLGANELKQVDAGSWYSEEFKGEPLLFLDDLLHLVKVHNLGLNLELKANPDIDGPRQIDALMSALESSDVIGPQLILSCFSPEALTLIRERNRDIQLAPLYESLPESLPETVRALQPTSIHCGHRHLTESLAKKYSHQFPLYCYTVNSADRLRTLRKWGVHGVFSDHAQLPEMAKALKG